MIHVVAVDESLVTTGDPRQQMEVWGWMRRSGWASGRLIAEIPRLDKFDHKIADGGSIARWRCYREAIQAGGKSIRVPDPPGANWQERAQRSPFVDCLVVKAPGGAPNPRKVLGFQEFLELDPLAEAVWNNHPVFLNTCGVILLASSRLDIVDHYLPLHPLTAQSPGKIPLVRYLENNLQFFQQQRRHLVFHIPDRLSQKHSLQVDPTETVSELLRRMNAAGLEKHFDITFRVWQCDKIHDRLLLGDRYGLHLGDGLNAEKRMIVVTRLNHPEAIRPSYEANGDNKFCFDISNRQPPTGPVSQPVAASTARP